MMLSDLKWPGGGFLLGLATTQLELDLTVAIYPLVAALLGLLWRLNSRLTVIETKFNVLDRVLERVVPGYKEE